MKEFDKEDYKEIRKIVDEQIKNCNPRNDVKRVYDRLEYTILDLAEETGVKITVEEVTEICEKLKSDTFREN